MADGGNNLIDSGVYGLVLFDDLPQHNVGHTTHVHRLPSPQTHQILERTRNRNSTEETEVEGHEQDVDGRLNGKGCAEEKETLETESLP